ATTQLKTASDEWMADFNDDGIAELAVGRIPSRTAAEANHVFGRLVARGTPSGAWANHALLVSDVSTDYDFLAASHSLDGLMPSSITKEHIDLSTTSGAQIASSIEDGQLLVNYIGHGSTEIWSSNAFDSATALTLDNGSELPFFVIMNCLNGYYHDLFTYSLGEALLNAPDGGAIGVWASSSLTQPDQQAIMNRELYRQLFFSKLPVGEAARRAKIATTDMDVRKSWILLGDPSMRLLADDNQTPVSQSIVTATPQTVVANGSATSTIVVQHKADDGANVTTGGATVTLSAASGSLSSVTDNGNGTYTATFTAPTSAGTATISGTLNGLPLANSELITLSPGNTVGFEINAPATTVSGEPFTVIVKAKDAHGNIAIDYEGQLHFTANDASAHLPSDHTLQPADDGVYTFNNVVLHTKGTRTIKVRDASNNAILGTASILVVPGETQTFVSSSPNPSTPGETVTLTANVTGNSAEAVTGLVTFYDGATTLGSASVNGGFASIAIASLSTGSHSITAAYGGDDTFAPSTSDAHTHTVMPVEIGATFISANATSGTSVSITWSVATNATGYDVFRSTANGAFTLIGQTASLAFVDSTVSAETSYLYKVRGRDGGGSTGPMSAADVATTVLFTDDPLLANTSKLKTVHITQLRTAVNALRAFAGLSAATFTDPTITSATVVKAAHITELRTALDGARTALGLAAIPYTDPALGAATLIKRAHVMQLRDGVR
ncbi:MAG TPA: C25 family cysteine peptidase, partial [Thermoanaerobaculia bacterium]